MIVRLQKFLAECGVGSRRKSEQLIKDGKIKVNEKIITELGTKIDDEKDIVMFNGSIVKHETKIYIMLNKPQKYVTTVKDQFARKSVIDLINIKERVFPVGRLDYDTEGMLLLTNDGDLSFKLTHPSHNVEKTYVVTVQGIVLEKELDNFRNGIYIDGRKTRSAYAKIIKISDAKTYLEVKIKEGRNRQIRKMFQSIGHDVIFLKRKAIGELKLGNLICGEFRYLSQKEVEYLKNL